MVSLPDHCLRYLYNLNELQKGILKAFNHFLKVTSRKLYFLHSSLKRVGCIDADNLCGCSEVLLDRIALLLSVPGVTTAVCGGVFFARHLLKSQNLSINSTRTISVFFLLLLVKLLAALRRHSSMSLYCISDFKKAKPCFPIVFFLNYLQYFPTILLI